ncbi:MAG: hypothetical protein IKN81_09080 [Oscillospiraceae bacterium]|nr:hypothetical protein [Oscillospiraceae bacterium]
MAEWSRGDVTLRAERSTREDAVHLGAQTPWGSGFASLRTGRRELLRTAGAVLFMLLRWGKERKKRASRRSGFRAAEKTRGSKHRGQGL